MGWNPFKDSWSDIGQKVEGYVKDQGKAQEHLFKAGTLQNNPLEELYKGHYYHQSSHPGVGISTDAWNRVGVNEGNIDETSGAIGTGAGYIFGPFGALIGGAAGAGLGAQMGDEDSYKDTYRAMGYGAAGGLLGAGAAEFMAPELGGSTTSVTSSQGPAYAGTMGGDVASLAAAESAAGLGTTAGPFAGSTVGPGGTIMFDSPQAMMAAESSMAPSAAGASAGIDVFPQGDPSAASGGSWFSDMFGGGDKMDYLKMLGKGALDYGQARQQQKALEPYTEANLAAMNRYNALMADPKSMYLNDPGLRQMRENRLNALEARQLKSGGGTRGGAYGRQLMRESSDIDRANLNSMLGNNLAMMGQTNPYVSQMQGLGGSPQGAAYSIGGGMLDDYISQGQQNQMEQMAFNKFLDYIMS